MTKYINEEQSIILTTHEISEIEMIADDVILIDEGKFLVYLMLKSFVQGMECL